MAVDQSQIEEYFSGDTLTQVKKSLTFLNEVGFWELLIKSNKFRLVDAFDSADEEELAKRIRALRQENKVYMTLNSLYPPQ